MGSSTTDREVTHRAVVVMMTMMSLQPDPEPH